MIKERISRVLGGAPPERATNGRQRTFIERNPQYRLIPVVEGLMSKTEELPEPEKEVTTELAKMLRGEPSRFDRVPNLGDRQPVGATD